MTSLQNGLDKAPSWRSGHGGQTDASYLSAAMNHWALSAKGGTKWEWMDAGCANATGDYNQPMGARMCGCVSAMFCVTGQSYLCSVGPVCPECVCLWPQKVHNSLPFLFSFLFLTFVMESWTSGAKTKFQSSTCLFSVQNQPVSNTGSSCFSLPCCPDPWPPLNRDLRGATWQTKAVITNTNQVQLRDYHWSTGSSTEVQWAGLSDLSDIFCVF